MVLIKLNLTGATFGAVQKTSKIKVRVVLEEGNHYYKIEERLSNLFLVTF